MITRRWQRRPSREDERGAVAVLTALAVVVVLAATAFAVDLGMSRASARDMQAVADAVALDTARWLPSCNATTLQSKANTSLARQGKTIGQDAPLSVVPGHIDSVTKQFVASSNGSGICDAVKIISSATVDYAFAPVIGTSSGTTSRSAVGTTSPAALCFSAGTRAVVLNTSESALGPLLDNILKLNLGVGGYSGLVDLKGLDVPLADLDVALKAGTGHGLVDDTNVSLAQLLIAQAAVLQQRGNAVQATVLETIAAQVTGLTVNVTDFLNLDTAGDAGLGAKVNALDFAGTAIIAAATVANGKNAVNLSSLGISVAGISLADAKLTIIEPPVIACGGVGTSASTAQVRLDLRTGVDVGGVAKAADISLGIQVAQGTATLSALTCATSNPTATISAQTSAANVVGYGGSGDAKLTIVSLLLLKLELGLRGSVASSSGSSHTFTFPSGNGLPQTHRFGSVVNLNLSIAPDSLLGLGSLLNLVVYPVLALVNAALTPVLTGVLALLGIKLGTMDVTALSQPSCDGVRLVG